MKGHEQRSAEVVVSPVSPLPTRPSVSPTVPRPPLPSVSPTVPRSPLPAASPAVPPLSTLPPASLAFPRATCPPVLLPRRPAPLPCSPPAWKPAHASSPTIPRATHPPAQARRSASAARPAIPCPTGERPSAIPASTAVASSSFTARPSGHARSREPRECCPPSSRRWPPTDEWPRSWAPPRSRRCPRGLCRSPWRGPRCPVKPLHRSLRPHHQRPMRGLGWSTAGSPPKSWRPTCACRPGRFSARLCGVSFPASGPAGNRSSSFERLSIS